MVLPSAKTARTTDMRPQAERAFGLGRGLRYTAFIGVLAGAVAFCSPVSVAEQEGTSVQSVRDAQAALALARVKAIREDPEAQRLYQRILKLTNELDRRLGEIAEVKRQREVLDQRLEAARHDDRDEEPAGKEPNR